MFVHPHDKIKWAEKNIFSGNPYHFHLLLHGQTGKVKVLSVLIRVDILE